MDTVREGDTLRRRARSRSTDDVTKGNSEGGGAASDAQPPPEESPTTQLLQEYEMHLRNTLAKGMDAESYSLHTFEQLLTQSMENLDKILTNDREHSSTLRPSARRNSRSSPHLPQLVRQSATLPSSMAHGSHRGWRGPTTNGHDDAPLNGRAPSATLIRPTETNVDKAFDDYKAIPPMDSRMLSQTLPAVPTRRNVKPHLAFEKRYQLDSEKQTVNNSGNVRPLHQPLLHALPTNIPRNQRKSLREKLLSEIASKHDMYKSKHGGGCIVLDANSEVNGMSFLSLWRSTDAKKEQEKNKITHRQSAFVLDDGKSAERYQQLVLGDKYSNKTRSSLTQPRRWNLGDDSKSNRGIMAAGAGAAKGAGPGGGGVSRGSERSLAGAGLRDERPTEHSGYFSDRNESFGSRRELYDRGYTSDHDRRFYDRQDSIRSGYASDHERGYASDRDSRGYMSDRERGGYMSDRERSGGAAGADARERGYTSDRERGYMSDRERGGYMSNRERGYYSDRERGYMSDRERGYVSDRERGYVSDRDSRGYASDRERGYYSDREHTALMAQASMESADSRLCYLTSSEISDDDRMSLTTAVSEDEDGESADASPYKGARGGTTAASFNCTGAVRKAGFLSVKKWLLRKKHQIELARKRGWKGYWVCLKGTTLLFYPCDSREGRSVEAAPKHLIIVDGAIMQPVPEHPKRDYIFCLSTAFGDAYLFQAPCQVELENWVNSIHSACAAAFARHRGKTGTLHLLQEEIFRIDRAIESDSKLKHMAELQLSVVSDVESKQQILGQIQQWEENLERLHCEQFRLRCYMASLQSGELPNPKGLLMHVSRSTKGTLSRLGVFTVSSFHAYICARSPSLLNNLLAGRGATKRSRAPMLSRSNSLSSRRSLQLQPNHEPDKVYKVSLPDNQMASITLREAMSVEEFLVAASSGRGLNPLEHFVRVKKRRELEETNYFVPHRTDLIENYLATHEVVEICAKILYQVELSRSSLDHMWGFSVEAELIENSERQDELCCYISRVEDRSTAMQNGIIKSDEIMVINGAIVSDLDMMYIESVLQEELALCLMMRSSRTEPPDLASLMKTTDEIIESLVCPPPPSESSLNEEMISSMIVPAPSWSKQGMAGIMQPPIGGIGGPPMGMNIPGMGMNNMGSVGALNSMGGMGYNNMGGYGMGGVMMGVHQQQVPHGMMQYGKEPASPDGFPPPASDSSDRSNVSSLEIESFLKAGGGGGNTSDLSGCSRSPVETRRPSHGGSVVGVAILPGCGPPSAGLDRERGMIDRDRMDRERDRMDRGMERERNNMDRRGSAGGGSVTSGSVAAVDRASPTGSLASSHSQSQLTPSRQLSHAERLRKVLSELVETEASYVKHLNNLLENYLEPLRNASFLTSAEVTALFGNIREIVAFQRLFLQALREAIDIEPDFNKFDQPYEFKTVLVSIASAFLYYASQFKLYSSFCASHSKAQKVLHPSEGNQALQEFLASRNPRQQHSATLESYLIKPIQRILKYPLLLQQLKNLTEPGTEENRHLVEALVVMEKVAEHINEMQRIHEEYGAIFDHLFRQHQKACKQVEYAEPVDLSPGDLLYYGGVEWLNISDFLGKIKKGLELHAMCFVFKTAVVFLCKERLRQKKKLIGSSSGKNSSSEVEIIRYQVLIPVTEVQVRASSMKDVDSHFLWELLHLKNQLQRRTEKVYHLSNSTSEFRNAFLKTIRQIIRESVRNMSIPNKPPGGGKEGGGSGASGGGSGRGGSVGGGGGGGGGGRGLNTNTLQSTRSGGPRKKQPTQNQSATLQRHSAGGMDYGGSTGNMESYDNVPETHHNGHVPQQQQHHEMNGAAAYRNRGKMGSDATVVASNPSLQSKTVTIFNGLPSTNQRGYTNPNQMTPSNASGQSPCNSTPRVNNCSTSNLTHQSTLPSKVVYQVDRTKNPPHMPPPARPADYSRQVNNTATIHHSSSAPKTTPTRMNIDDSINGSAPQLPGDLRSHPQQIHPQLPFVPHAPQVNHLRTNYETAPRRPLDMRLSPQQISPRNSRPHSETPLTVRQPFTVTIDVKNSHGSNNPAASPSHYVQKQSHLLNTPPNLRYKNKTDHGNNSNSHRSNLADTAVRLTVQSETIPRLNATGNGSYRNTNPVINNISKTSARGQPQKSCASPSVSVSQLPRSSPQNAGTVTDGKSIQANYLNQTRSNTSNKTTSPYRYPARTAYVRSNSDSDVCFGNYDPLSHTWSNETNDLKSSSQNELRAGLIAKELPPKQTTGRTNHSLYNKQLPFSYNQHKTSGNSSDTEINNHYRSPHRKLHSSSSQNFEVSDDTYDYPDLMKKSQANNQFYDKCTSPTHLTRIPRRNENGHNQPVIRRDIKSSIVVNGDVPSLLKCYEKQEPSVLTTCDVRRIREVEKIVKGWQVERIIQSNEENPSPPFKNLRTSNQRTVDRTESRHKELRGLDTFTDVLSTIPTKPHQSSSPVSNSSGVSTTRRSSGFSPPHASLSSMRSPTPSLSSSSLSSTTSSGTRPPSSRSTYRLPTESSSPGIMLSSRPRHSESDSLPTSTQARTSTSSTHLGSVPRSNSMEGITIESLMEQLKALS